MIEFFQRAKAQCDDLTRVAALSLTVDTTHMSASAVGQLVPSLRSLSLRGRVPTIRDLGTHFALLTTLHLPSCNLADLDGIHAFPALIDLNVAHNRITDVSPLSLAESLVVLDVGHNKLADWTQIEELALLATLRDLTVAGNPVVAATAAPRDRVLAILPHLRSLDGVAVTLTALSAGGVAGIEWDQCY
ncbi:Leucine-rich repeat-containing protein 56 [Allomyces javanicus]|nr:Leucine-rich repeat-containing protein 56 [Allomyces javanicus]